MGLLFQETIYLPEVQGSIPAEDEKADSKEQTAVSATALSLQAALMMLHQRSANCTPWANLASSLFAYSW